MKESFLSDLLAFQISPSVAIAGCAVDRYAVTFTLILINSIKIVYNTSVLLDSTSNLVLIKFFGFAFVCGTAMDSLPITFESRRPMLSSPMSASGRSTHLHSPTPTTTLSDLSLTSPFFPPQTPLSYASHSSYGSCIFWYLIFFFGICFCRCNAIYSISTAIYTQTLPSRLQCGWMCTATANLCAKPQNNHDQKSEN